MSAKGTVLSWAAAGGLVAAGAATWLFAPSIVRDLVFFRPRAETPSTATEEEVTSLQARVDTALAALGAAEGPRLAHSTEVRTDRAGAWAVRRLRWELPTGTDAVELGGRLRALLAAQRSTSDVYVVRGEAGDAQVRVYVGARLASVVDLSPTLCPWPALSPAQQPQLALVLTGIDAEPHAARALMEEGLPLAVALSPYSPFTLRLSRDALSTHSEVLAQAEPDATLSEALEGVPWATGVLVTCPLLGDPEGEAASLARADTYVIDGTETGLDTRWRTALETAHVPVLRPLALDPTDPETALRRQRHAAVQHGGAILTLPLEAGRVTLDAIQAACALGYRAAYPAEIVALTSSTPASSAPVATSGEAPTGWPR
jgi:hypothetical protein